MDSNNMCQTPQQSRTHSPIGIAGMVSGILAIITACLFFGRFIGITGLILSGFIGIPGLLLSIIGIAQKNRKHWMAIVGILMNVLAILITILVCMAIRPHAESAPSGAANTQTARYTSGNAYHNPFHMVSFPEQLRKRSATC